ncbi:ABC transporter ATP-binding protein [Pseudomonas sp. SWI6]|uniref:ABC transporter ATP-binding protein n=1 Tax=Pseudomonas taiwanensis TaxID=470150 RepID=A0ABR6V1I8_9PSED|nr:MULTISPECIES: ATP-binding cassette domain-containing protein [Pseudomonas]AGZ36007.1 ABC transporter [Pseudomonas sp. VLB120]AVD82492.1 ABC transporter ATP-binding protein [Pseudomonas sp. SWI6]MBC3474040.1 ABC transporter ATP-binding protein [Pseudomonas taiwanensis]MBC3491426.1 ABC transporter ATP-binding protein [Pseudomonas taiwanensis]MPT01183.1 ABC transporter ATP-binding protein [Pseudomonas sp.]
MELVIEAKAVARRFLVKASGQAVQALHGLDLTLRKGTLTALVGPDGAGKTTFLRLVAGLLQADSGELNVLGVDVKAHPQKVQDLISYMPQRFGLYEDLSVQENLDLYADLHGVGANLRRQRFERLLAMTDLTHFTRRPAGKLSGGMKQKLGLACTLVRSPQLLLLDEPTVGVDPLSRRELWEIVQQLVREENLSVLLSTSYLDEAERCSEVYMLHQGELLAQGMPQDIRRHADGLCYLATPPAGQPARTLQARLLGNTHTIIDAVPQSGEVRFMRQPDADQQTLDTLLGGAPVRPVEARLEDGFMFLLRARSDAEHVDMETLKTSAPSDPHSSEPAIEVKDLVRTFGDFTAVASTSFSVRRGEIFGLLGPNGAGKTTTFRMLCGLLPASSGSLQVAGVNLRHARAKARRRVGYVSQKFSLYGNLSVRENLEFFGGAYGLPGKQLQRRMDEVAQQFDLSGHESDPSGQLPGGFKQRLAMAVGLLHEPEILFLDEPTSGADPLARRGFWQRITALAAAGTTIIITTHFMEEAEYCDRIVIQDAGKLIAMGTPQEVREQAAGKGSTLNMEQAFIAIVEQERQQQQVTPA